MIADIIRERSSEEREYVVELRRYLHKHPELSENEYNTSKKIQEELKKIGIEYVVYQGTNAIVGLIKGEKDGKTVALRADMDALPINEENDVPYKSENEGVMHACGHDGHTAILLGTARVLYSIRDKLHGNVKLLFQPAEETIGGAEAMIANGCMENPKVSYVFGLHMDPDIECGTIRSRVGALNANGDDIEITVKGKKSHGATPELGIDAIYVASNIVVSLQSIISRRISPFDNAVMTIGKIQGGTANNVVADRVSMYMMLRTTDFTVRDNLKDWIEKNSRLTAEANGAECDVKFTPSYIASINDKECIEIVENVSNEFLGDNSYYNVEHPFLGLEDFSYFLTKAKGAFYQLGCGNKKKGITSSTHTSTFDMDEYSLVNGMMMQAGIVYKLIGEK